MSYESDLIKAYQQAKQHLNRIPTIAVTPLCVHEPFDHEPINIWVPSISYIIKLVALHEQVSIIDILSQRRTKHATRARLIIYYLCRHHTTHSTPTIGYHLGGRDHSTIISGARRVAGRRLRDFRLNERLKFYESHLNSRPKAS